MEDAPAPAALKKKPALRRLKKGVSCLVCAACTACKPKLAARAGNLPAAPASSALDFLDGLEASAKANKTGKPAPETSGLDFLDGLEANANAKADKTGYEACLQHCSCQHGALNSSGAAGRAPRKTRTPCQVLPGLAVPHMSASQPSRAVLAEDELFNEFTVELDDAPDYVLLPPTDASMPEGNS